ncbi:MAG: glycosyltransferase family 39 protein [Actinomycetota bacterium]|nr:glycosyltransferase family 39 protein [Actinomycetota bacterium]
MARRTLYALLGLTALAALARFATLDLQSFHHDEAVTAGQVLDPNLGATLNQVADGERSPPLYYVLAWAWSTIFGTGEVGLRSLSALLGTLMVPAAFFGGRALASEGVGLAAALLFAFNPYLVWYSQEARSYILMALFATVAIASLAAHSRGGERRAVRTWALASALALLSHYFAVFLIVPQALWLLAGAPDRRRLVAPLAALALVAFALVPLTLTQQGSERRDGFADRPVAERVAEVGLNYVASEDPDPLSGSRRVDAVQFGAGVVGLILVCLAGLILARRWAPHDEDEGSALLPAERNASLLLAALAGITIGVPALLAFAGLDLLNPRNLLAGVVPVLLVAALVFGNGRRRLAAIGLAATATLFAAVVVAVNLSAEMQREDWRGAAEAMGEPAGVRIVVAPKNGDDPLELYLDAVKFEGPRFEDGLDVEEIEVLGTGGTVHAPEGYEERSTVSLPPLFELTSFVAPGTRRLAPEDLYGVLGGRTVVLIDRP